MALTWRLDVRTRPGASVFFLFEDEKKKDRPHLVSLSYSARKLVGFYLADSTATLHDTDMGVHRSGPEKFLSLR